jgi:hypothetical protein
MEFRHLLQHSFRINLYVLVADKKPRRRLTTDKTVKYSSEVLTNSLPIRGCVIYSYVIFFPSTFQPLPYRSLQTAIPCCYYWSLLPQLLCHSATWLRCVWHENHLPLYDVEWSSQCIWIFPCRFRFGMRQYQFLTQNAQQVHRYSSSQTSSSRRRTRVVVVIRSRICVGRGIRCLR